MGSLLYPQCTHYAWHKGNSQIPGCERMIKLFFFSSAKLYQPDLKYYQEIVASDFLCYKANMLLLFLRILEGYNRSLTLYY